MESLYYLLTLPFFVKLFNIWVSIVFFFSVYYYYFVKNKNRRNKILVHIMYIFSGLMWLALQGINGTDTNDYKCAQYSYFRASQINNEIVINKMKTDVRMIGEIIVLHGFKENRTDTLFLVCDVTNSFNIIKWHDTLFKKKNSDSLFKLQNGELVLINKIDYECDTNKYKRKHHQDIYHFTRFKQ